MSPLSLSSIHCLLGRHLTVEQCLGLQVEGWKLGANGEPSLIGKTAFLPRLTLTASPQGRPGLGFDGGFDDISRAIDSTHSHDNKTLLDSYTQTEEDIAQSVEMKHSHANKALLDAYDGKTGGVTVVDNYTNLPADAVEGNMVYVRSDTVTGAGAPIDLNGIPEDKETLSQIEAAYIVQGGTVYDSGWNDFRDNYTNCNYPEVKLGTPTYNSNMLLRGYGV